MGELYVRNVKASSLKSLDEQAKLKGVSRSELVRRIIDAYTANPQVVNIEEKYRSFAEDLIGIYQMSLADIESMSRRNEEIFLKTEAMTERLEQIIKRIE